MGTVLVIALLSVACNEQTPRSFYDFMDDALARDGALARCNQDRDAALTDMDCVNARRAAAAVAVAAEQARSRELAAESERKLTARRDYDARQQDAETRALEEATAAAEAAYDAQWREPQTQQPAESAGSAMTAVAPPMSDLNNAADAGAVSQ